MTKPRDTGLLDPKPAMEARLPAAIGVALLHCGASYMLLRYVSETWLISIAFLLVQPAAITAFVCYVADLNATRPRRFYTLVPVWLVGLANLLGLLIFKEGVICTLMLAPIWLGIGVIAARLTYRWRRRPTHSQAFVASGLLALPAVMFAVEPHFPREWQTFEVTRSVDIAARADHIWPLMRGAGNIGPAEGRWNLAQDVIGVPRPLAANLDRDGPGAIRRASWQRGVQFAEVVTIWKPNQAIAWRFDFADSSGWQFTDPHLRPDSDYFHIDQGGYRLTRKSNRHYHLELWTRYAIRTPVNLYAAAWGQALIGGIEANLLGLIKDRAEGSAPPSSLTPARYPPYQKAWSGRSR